MAHKIVVKEKSEAFKKYYPTNADKQIFRGLIARSFPGTYDTKHLAESDMQSIDGYKTSRMLKECLDVIEV